MKFEQALAAMREGKKVRRKSWMIKEEYFHIYKENKVREILKDERNEPCKIEDAEILANNWEIYTEPAKPLDFYEALKIVEGGGEAKAENDIPSYSIKMFCIDGQVKFALTNRGYNNLVLRKYFRMEWYEV